MSALASHEISGAACDVSMHESVLTLRRASGAACHVRAARLFNGIGSNRAVCSLRSGAFAEKLSEKTWWLQASPFLEASVR